MDKKKVLLQTLPVLLLCGLGGGLSGFILGNMTSVLDLIPGLIALIPAIIGMRGNISSAMGSRLGSAVHLGLVEKGISSDIALENLKSSISLSVFVGFLLPIFFWVTTFLFSSSIRLNIILVLMSISLLTGITSGILLSLLAFFIIIISIRYEIDPDNITGPLLTTVGDVTTLIILFSYSYLIGGVFL